MLLFVATTVNYLDRQVLSLTWKDFIAPEFHWTDADYGTITAVFSLVYALCMLFAGRFIDWMGTKKGYLWAIGVWSAGACLHAACGWATMHIEGFESVKAMTSGGPGEDTALIAYRITTEAFTNLNIGYAATLAVMLFLVMALFSFINMRFISKISD